MPTKQIVSLNTGYSLIEVITGIGIFAVLALSSVNLFFNTTAGSTKDNSTRTVKQAGDYAISTFETNIRFTDRLMLNVDDPQTICEQDMSSISFVEPINQTQETWSVEDNRIKVNNEFITGEDLVVEDNRLYIDCSIDPGSGVAYINLQFTLINNNQDADQTESIITQSYETSVTIRNR